MENLDLSYKKMQELLPDYVFGRLSENEKLMFEKHLNNYPDLIEEINEIHAVFKRVEDMDFDKKITERAKNMSVNVNRRLNNSKAPNRSFINSFKFALPALAIIVIGMLVYSYYLEHYSIEKDNTLSISEESQMTVPKILSPNEELVIVQDIETIDDFLDASINLNYTDESFALINSDFIIDFFDDYIEAYLFQGLANKYLEQNYLFNNPAVDSYLLFLNQLNSLDEQEIQNILKGLDDATFTS